MIKFKSTEQSIFKKWIIVGGGFVLSTIIIIAFLMNLKDEIYNNKILEIQSFHNILLSHIDEFKSKENRLIETLSKNDDVINFATNYADTIQIEKLFTSFIQAKKTIMQLRFIDKNGMEHFRIDQDRKENIIVVNKSQLQDKSNRPYMKEFFALKKDEIGYSKFDLNVENGKIEIPFNPTIRVGKAVYQNEKLLGYVVINYFMEEWLDIISTFIPYEYMIIDKNNYFMHHFNEKWEWSQYQTEKKLATQYTLLNNLPNWQKEHQEFYTFGNQFIAKRIQIFSDDTLIVYHLKDSISSQTLPLLLEYTSYLLLSFLALFLPISFLIYVYVKLTKQNAEYENHILNNMFDSLFVINQRSIIQHVNISAQKLFGYNYEELINQNINMLIPEPHHHKHDQYVANSKQEERLTIGKNRDIEAVDKNGNTFPVSLAVTKTVVDNEVFFIGVVRDLRELRDLELVNEKQIKILHEQSKLASMGEMIGAIAHQWRQPLNELSIRIQKLKYAYAKEQINEEFIQEFIQKNKTTISFMSKTIDDFRNFFRIDKEKIKFDIKEALEEVINIQSAQLKHNHINIELEGKDFIYEGYKSEFQQVILNLISNSRDALISNNIQSPKVMINLNKNIIKFRDNGGGINKEILNRVFEPYFTTKEQGKGTGMGLYMSKMIIEDNMDGKLEINNENDGVLITIDLRVKR